LEFNGGAFRTNTGDWILAALKLYNDGLVAETQSNTNHTEAFLYDLTGFLTKQFRLRFEESVIKEKHFLSQVVVSSAAFSRIADPRMAAFAEYLTRMFRFSSPSEMTGIHFGPDPATLEGKSFGMRLERKSGTPFSEAAYFSEAPTATDTHIEILQKLEEILNERPLCHPPAVPDRASG
jgi:hypothetical protein